MATATYVVTVIVSAAAARQSEFSPCPIRRGAKVTTVMDSPLPPAKEKKWIKRGASVSWNA